MGKRLNTIAIGGGLIAGALYAGEAVTGYNLFPDFPGGQSDEAPKGELIIQEQEVETASDSFQIQIGTGTAHVSVEASQNWDKPGPFWDGDFQSTNGTASVSDPNGGPALLELEVEYCTDGDITAPAREAEPGEKLPRIVFDMDGLRICDVELLPTPENLAAFHQDDTPPEFQGAFESAIQQAVILAAKAQACPDELGEAYTDPDYLFHVRSQLAEEYGVSEEHVEVLPGTPRRSDAATRGALQEELDAILADNPELDIAFLTGGTAIEDSCFLDADAGVELDSLEGLATATAE